MSIWLTAIILGIVEGLTEFLPVSSTGHLILATELLGYDAAKWAVFNIAIQPGAILAIVVLYWRTFRDIFTGLLRRDPVAFAFVRNLLLAFIPAVVLGLAFGDYIEALLENAVVVAWALIIGGVGILIVERFAKPKESGGVAALSTRQSIIVGLVQCIAMIPGVSRSGATIMGAMALGIDRKTAAEFSFFLALPTLTGATVLQLAKHHDAITKNDIGLIALGAFVSFVVAWAVIKAFLAVVTRYGFAPFAWYRIIVGVAALVWLAAR
ncbi:MULTISPECIES: undecaprenyl-diphosphate phosphatase [unclassified Sphingopyxis]|uniref:undecaprenyl-diphosphate phosphatase n=1 Tax=unclassified Sphingopyxis TaxID=2614943 RepID=UPI000731A6C1|nr:MULTISPECIES: undecaprenyl-diphosphate phosphatase [unclassified Sphingopyxis]KTE23892.1 UDP-diphosphatase [Sphingopyxis sp. H057]KTE51045.1 UDP-diphosphatase [Sphingopyxis sp. H073]KTE51256.1 UDP-diphosphatase [Sphingopyxis sp. H071]KTE58837.1 UDP-diphosphatase [Sphingopyxis sp. H107]KTE61228.1 UDP-diphosphatase [Sphingopyxis sp. H100]